MKRWLLTGIEQLQLESFTQPKLRSGWVRLRIKYCGICGSDLHSYKGKHPMVHPPIVLGHEFSAVVEDIGEGVESSWIGRAVVVEPSIPCGTCYACQHGQYHICHHLQVIGNIGVEGALAELIDVPADRLVVVPKGMDLMVAALVEPTAVSVHAINRVGMVTGGVVVIGGGPIGLLTALIAKAKGIGPVLLMDIRPSRIEMARTLGIDVVINSSISEELQIVSTIFPHGPGAVFDCVASSATLNLALDLARNGTAIVLEGVPEDALTIDAVKIQDRELSLVGTLMYQRGDFEQAIAMLSDNLIPGRELITEIVGFTQVKSVFDRLIHNPTDEMKTLVQIFE